MVRIVSLALLALGAIAVAVVLLRGDRAAPMPDAGPAPVRRAERAVPDPAVAAERSRRDVLPGALTADLEGRRAVAGFVTGADGGRAPRAVVWLLDAAGTRRFATVTADASGAFAFPLDGVPDGDGLALAAHHPAHGLAAATSFTPPATGVARVDLECGTPGLELRGTVRGPGGDPVPGHPVALALDVGADPAATDWRAGVSGVELTTGPDGRFVARGLRAGTWDVDFDVDGQPIGFGEITPPPLRSTAALPGAVPLDLAVPFVRIDVDASPAPVDRIVALGFTGRDADLARGIVAAGGAAEAAGRAEQRVQRDANRASFHAAPGVFVVLRASGAGRDATRALDVATTPSVRAVALELDATRGGGIALDVTGPDGTRPKVVVVRVWPAVRQSGVVALDGESLGSGWYALPERGRIALPAGTFRVEVLGDPLEARREWFALELASAELEVVVPATAGFVAHAVRLRTGAWLELEVHVAAQLSETGRIASRTPSGDDTPELGVSASLAGPDGLHRVVRLAIATDDGGWRSARTVPLRLGTTVRMRVLGVFEPGLHRLAMQTWRPASVDDTSGWPVALAPGRNVATLRIDADGVLWWAGR